MNFSDNSKYKFIKPEDVKLDTMYSLSINPEQQHFAETKRVDEMKCHLQELVNGLSGLVDGYMECSSGGRLHFHGTILFKSLDGLEHFYLFDVPSIKHLATVEMDTIEDMDKWDEYCEKNKRFTFCKHIKTSEHRAELIINSLHKKRRNKLNDKSEGLIGA